MLVLRGAIWPRKEAAVIGVKRNLVTTPAKPGSYQPLVARRSITYVFQYFFVLYILLSPVLCFYGCMFNMQNIQKKQKNPAAYAAGLHSNPNQK